MNGYMNEVSFIFCLDEVTKQFIGLSRFENKLKMGK